MTIRHLFDREDLYILTADRTDGDRPKWQSKLVELIGPNYGARVEWSLLYPRGFGYGIQIGRNGSESDLGLDLYAGPLGSLWTRIRAPWLKWVRVSRDHPRWYEPRHTGFRFHPFDGAFFTWEIDQADGWSSSTPWWRAGSITKTTILGRVDHQTVEGDHGATSVPMPEGVYPATWTEKISTTWYVRFPGTWIDKVKGRRTSRRIDLSIEDGIPVEGKGENSYDCGMDGVFGTSGSTVEEAVANCVRGVLRGRKNYGGPHHLPRPMTITEAEEYGRQSRG